MELKRRDLIGAGLGLALAASPAAAQWGDPPTPAKGDPAAPPWPPAERLPLWPEGRIPGAPASLPIPNPTMNGAAGHRELWVRGVASPEIAVFRPARPDGTALLSFPGGGYEFLSVQNEGLDVARRFTASGTTVFVLAYRLPGEGWGRRELVPLQDAQRSIRLIRANAARYGIDPAKLGIVGFSAGGHLGADIATAYDKRAYDPIDAADTQSAKPAFAGLIYAVTTLESSVTHSGSMGNLLGPNPSPALILDRSPLRHVTRATPPVFLTAAFDDGTVPIANSLEMITACRAAQVPVEAHLIEKGGHGFGLHLPPANPGSLWPDLFNLWFRTHV